MKTTLTMTRSPFLLSRKHIPFSFRKEYLLGLFITILICSCNSENANDCLQTDGDIITYDLALPAFEKIQLENDIRVVLQQGDVQHVRIETGENLVSDLVITVDQETLILQNNNGCNFIRDYGVTIVTVTSPNITFIRQASSFEISSAGTLTYPNLTIWSNTNPNSLSIVDANKSGSVILNVDTERLTVSANGSSDFQISGRADVASVSFTDEFPQFNGQNFLVDDLTVNQTSAANMIVNPQLSIKGIIKGVGDVISVNEPPLVDVEQLFTGRLIFDD